VWPRCEELKIQTPDVCDIAPNHPGCSHVRLSAYRQESHMMICASVCALCPKHILYDTRQQDADQCTVSTHDQST